MSQTHPILPGLCSLQLGSCRTSVPTAKMYSTARSEPLGPVRIRKTPALSTMYSLPQFPMTSVAVCSWLLHDPSPSKNDMFFQPGHSQLRALAVFIEEIATVIQHRSRLFGSIDPIDGHCGHPVPTKQNRKLNSTGLFKGTSIF